MKIKISKINTTYHSIIQFVPVFIRGLCAAVVVTTGCRQTTVYEHTIEFVINMSGYTVECVTQITIYVERDGKVCSVIQLDAAVGTVTFQLECQDTRCLVNGESFVCLHFTMTALTYTTIQIISTMTVLTHMIAHC